MTGGTPMDWKPPRYPQITISPGILAFQSPAKNGHPKRGPGRRPGEWETFFGVSLGQLVFFSL